MNETQRAEWETQIRIMATKLRQARLLLQMPVEYDFHYAEAADLLSFVAIDAKGVSDRIRIFVPG